MIRPATDDDADWICAIWNRIISETTVTFTTLEKSPQDVRALMAETPFLAAPDEAGFGTLNRFRGGPGYNRARELTIYLAEGARGRGLGRRLIAALEAQARTMGVDTLIAGVSGTNPGAVTFHERMGFQIVARMPAIGEKWGQRIDLLLLQKNLSQ